jgi:hypothetical protein
VSAASGRVSCLACWIEVDEGRAEVRIWRLEAETRATEVGFDRPELRVEDLEVAAPMPRGDARCEKVVVAAIQVGRSRVDLRATNAFVRRDPAVVMIGPTAVDSPAIPPDSSGADVRAASHHSRTNVVDLEGEALHLGYPAVGLAARAARVEDRTF